MIRRDPLITEDLQRLLPLGEDAPPTARLLNDAVINAGLTVIAEAASKQDIPTWSVSSFLFDSVDASSWWKRIPGKSFLAFGKLLFPQHHSDHWFLVAAEPGSRSIWVMDSNASSMSDVHSARADDVASFLSKEEAREGKPSGLPAWDVHWIRTPRQTNHIDCGVHTLAAGA